MQVFLELQRTAIIETYERLSKLDNEFVSAKKGTSWSAKEIIGHLIDSASNNHGRIIRAQFTEDMVFLPYDQDAWVKAGDYQNADWNEVLTLWKYFNLILIHAASNIPEDVLTKERTKHNLQQLAFKRVPETQTITLEYFIRDYFDHLHHHLNAIRIN